MGAFCAYFLLSLTGIGYWWALLIAPIVVGIFGMILERTMLQWLAGLDHLYGLLLTFGIALIVQGVFQNYFGSSGLPYAIPDYPQIGEWRGLQGGMVHFVELVEHQVLRSCRDEGTTDSAELSSEDRRFLRALEQERAARERA